MGLLGFLHLLKDLAVCVVEGVKKKEEKKGDGSVLLVCGWG